MQGLAPVAAITSNGEAPATPVVGPLVDVAAMDRTGLLCSEIAAGSLQGRIALIQRGTCTFDSKLNYAREAGAVAAVMFAAEDSPEPFSMNVGTATLPAEMIGYLDAQSIKTALAGQKELWGTVSFTLGPVASIGNRMTDFTATGPNVDLGIKPDLMAMGRDIYTATQSLDPSGEMYSASGFVTVDGTSFSTPMVAGAAALLKSARPGLTVDQYRSLLINTAGTAQGITGGVTGMQQTGGGSLDVQAALNATVTAYPVSLSFGAGGVNAAMTSRLTIANVGPGTETFTISVEPRNEMPGPAVETASVELAPGASADMPVSFVLRGTTVGPHEGYVVVSGTTTGTHIRVPYWYAATEYVPAHINVMSKITGGRRGSVQRDALKFRVLDVSGVALSGGTPEVTVTSGGGTVRRVRVYDSQVPGVFGLDVQLGLVAGANVFRIQAGDITTEVSIAGQ